MASSAKVERLAVDASLEALIEGIVRANPNVLGHVRSERIAIVLGAARLDSAASIRPLASGAAPARPFDGRFVKPTIRFRGARMLYEICLRPRFFVRVGQRGRLRILIHELLHIGRAFDGTLDPERRHGAAGSTSFDAELDAIVATTERAIPLSAMTPIAHVGLVEMWGWLARPPSRIRVGSGLRTEWDERDLYRAVIEQR